MESFIYKKIEFNYDSFDQFNFPLHFEKKRIPIFPLRILSCNNTSHVFESQDLKNQPRPRCCKTYETFVQFYYDLQLHHLLRYTIEYLSDKNIITQKEAKINKKILVKIKKILFKKEEMIWRINFPHDLFNKGQKNSKIKIKAKQLKMSEIYFEKQYKKQQLLSVIINGQMNNQIRKIKFFGFDQKIIKKELQIIVNKIIRINFKQKKTIKNNKQNGILFGFYNQSKHLKLSLYYKNNLVINSKEVLKNGKKLQTQACSYFKIENKKQTYGYKIFSIGGIQFQGKNKQVQLGINEIVMQNDKAQFKKMLSLKKNLYLPSIILHQIKNNQYSLYLIGGFQYNNFNVSTSIYQYSYKVSSNQFSFTNEYNVLKKRCFQNAFLIQNKIYILGGTEKNVNNKPSQCQFFKYIEIFDTQTKKIQIKTANWQSQQNNKINSILSTPNIVAPYYDYLNKIQKILIIGIQSNQQQNQSSSILYNIQTNSFQDFESGVIPKQIEIGKDEFPSSYGFNLSICDRQGIITQNQYKFLHLKKTISIVNLSSIYSDTYNFIIEK